MRATWWFARQGLAARRGRTALLAIAVLLASALVAAVACGLESARGNAEASLRRSIGATDARLVNRFGAAFDGKEAERVRALPGIDAVATSLGGSLSLIRADGGRDDDGKPRRVVAQTRGLEAGSDARFRMQEMRAGRLPVQSGEIAVDPLTAKALACAVGDQLQVQRFGDPIALTVTGIIDRAALGALQRPYVVVDRSTLVEANGSDQVTTVMVALKAGTNVPEWVALHAPEFKEPLSLEPSELYTTGFDKQMLALRLGFVLISAIAFMSCAFIVGTGMTTAVAEQQKELAIARCVGASRRQVFMSQIWAGAALCGAAGIAGIPLGVGLAALLRWWFREWLSDGFFMSWAGIGLAIGGSLIAGIGGSLWPAWQASSTSPLAALAPRVRAPRRAGIVWLGVAGLACIAAQIALLVVPDSQARFWTYALLGIPLLHAGWFMLSVPMLWVVAAVASGGMERALRIPRGLLSGAVRQAPYRLGFTAGALMVGVSILTSTWTNGTAVVRDISERVRISDGFVFKANGMTVAEQNRIKAIPGVQGTVPIGYLPLKVIGETVFGVEGVGTPNVVCIGFPPDEFLALNRLEWIQGSPESALPKLKSGAGILVAKEFLIARGKETGDHIRLGGGKTEKEYEIVGVVGAAGLDVAVQFFGIRSVYTENAVSCVFMDFDEVARSFGSREAFILQIDIDDASPPELDSQLGDAVTDRVPGAVFASGRAIRKTILEVGDRILMITSTIAFAALALACFGVGNVVAANIGARTFEYGVLRATGATPGLLARLVLGEVLLLTIAGAAIGTALGLHLARMGVLWHKELGGQEIGFELPLRPIVIGWVVLTLMTVASAMPAVRALMKRSVRELVS
ncbi:MAG: ABC transporter permease [Planctomycetota bacterium]|nr:MAG: ABC transporter permease [Planctomycetota bacterium]